MISIFRWKAVLLVSFVSLAGLNLTSASVAIIHRPFDQYGNIRWEDEKARLDNFAVQLQNAPDFIGYIIVNDGRDLCAREAQERAMRAKRYVVEYRGVPWNRVIWKLDSYIDAFEITLLLGPREATPDYPYRSWIKKVTPEVHLTKIAQIELQQLREASESNSSVLK